MPISLSWVFVMQVAARVILLVLRQRLILKRQGALQGPTYTSLS